MSEGLSGGQNTQTNTALNLYFKPSILQEKTCWCCCVRSFLKSLHSSFVFFPPEIIVHRSPLLPRTISVLFNLGAPICHVSSSAKRRDLGRPKYKIDCSDLLLLTAIASNEMMTRSSTFKKSPRSQNLKTIVSGSYISLSKSLIFNITLVEENSNLFNFQAN